MVDNLIMGINWEERLIDDFNGIIDHIECLSSLELPPTCPLLDFQYRAKLLGLGLSTNLPWEGLLSRSRSGLPYGWWSFFSVALVVELLPAAGVAAGVSAAGVSFQIWLSLLGMGLSSNLPLEALPFGPYLPSGLPSGLSYGLYSLGLPIFFSVALVVELPPAAGVAAGGVTVPAVKTGASSVCKLSWKDTTARSANKKICLPFIKIL